MTLTKLIEGNQTVLSVVVEYDARLREVTEVLDVRVFDHATNTSVCLMSLPATCGIDADIIVDGIDWAEVAAEEERVFIETI